MPSLSGTLFWFDDILWLFLFLFLRDQENLKPETLNGVYHQQRCLCKCFSLIYCLLVSVYVVVSTCQFSSLMQLLIASVQSLMRVAHCAVLNGQYNIQKGHHKVELETILWLDFTSCDMSQHVHILIHNYSEVINTLSHEYRVLMGENQSWLLLIPTNDKKKTLDIFNAILT